MPISDFFFFCQYPLLVFLKERQNSVASLLCIKGAETNGKSYMATVPSPRIL